MNPPTDPQAPGPRHRATLRRLCIAWLMATASACDQRVPAEPGPPATPAPSPLGAAGGVEGVDLSNWQGGDVDFEKIKQSGKLFVFVKSSQGSTVVDPDHARNVRQARAAGLMVGSYHFYVSSDPPQAQFRNFSAQLALEPGDLPPVVDIERLSQGDPRALVPALQQFLGLLEEKHGVKPILYSGEYFANEYLSVFGAYPLWLAEYNGGASPQLPKGWARWTFWQYSQNGSLADLSGPVDLNRFNGSAEQLKALAVR